MHINFVPVVLLLELTLHVCSPEVRKMDERTVLPSTLLIFCSCMEKSRLSSACTFSVTCPPARALSPCIWSISAHYAFSPVSLLLLSLTFSMPGLIITVSESSPTLRELIHPYVYSQHFPCPDSLHEILISSVLHVWVRLYTQMFVELYRIKLS